MTHNPSPAAQAHRGEMIALGQKLRRRIYRSLIPAEMGDVKPNDYIWLSRPYVYSAHPDDACRRGRLPTDGTYYSLPNAVYTRWLIDNGRLDDSSLYVTS